jgi:two-component system, chemotaxis family, response regulator PixG
MVENNSKSAEISFKDLIIQLNNIKSQSFSGNLIVKVEMNLSWMFSFRLGHLGWVSGGVDPIDCWQRNLALARLDLPSNKLAEINNPLQKVLNSNLLAELLLEDLIDRQKSTELVSMITAENLFDIIQFSQHSGNRLSYNITQTGAGNSELNLVLPLLEIDPILRKSIQTWQEWSNAGLAVYAPSLFPVISKSAEVLTLLTDSDLRQTVLGIDGNRSLHRLAGNNRQSLLEFTSNLLPLFRSGFITLSPQPKSKINTVNTLSSSDLSSGVRSSPLNYFASQSTNSTSIENSSAKQSPLIACIDDSILIYQSLDRILTEHGYRHYGVQDPLKIMPSLIRNKPDFIFLDLLMPITNGYEVCEQIRKTPSLKHIPVIILTGKDGLIDRMRSKMVGATGFLGKPVEEESVLKMLEKYLVVGK